MAMACLRLFTVLPLRPLLRVPRLRLCIARLTSFDAAWEYRRAMLHSPRSFHLNVKRETRTREFLAAALRRAAHAAFTLSPSKRSALPWASFARSAGDSDSDFRKAWPRALGA